MRLVAKNTTQHAMPDSNQAHQYLDTANLDHVPSSVKHSGSSAMLYVFVDNEAFFDDKKGRSPTMRHVSRTHRVALDWLFDRFNVYSRIQFRYIDTKHQLADISPELISHVTNGTNFFICSTLATSALLLALIIPA